MPLIGSDDRKQLSLDLLERFQDLSRSSPQDVERFALEKLAEIWRVARQSNSWWRQYLPPWREVFDPSLGMNGLLAKLPVMTRSVVQDSAAFSSVWLANSSVNEYGSASTSGSTGKPVKVLKHGPSYDIGIFAASLQETLWHERDMSLPTLHLRNQKVGREKSQIRAPFSFLWSSGANFSLRIAETSPRAVLEFIQHNQIVNIFGANNFLRLLANEQLNYPVKHSVEHFVNWAEALSPTTRELLNTAFGAHVADRYSSEELGLIAIQCPVDTHLHTLQYYNWVEIVDEKGVACKTGEPGRVLITNLRNLAQPLIRYELGDMATWAEPCGEGISLPVLEPLITRQRETIPLDDGRWIQPNASGCLLAKESLVTDFQVYRFNNALLVLYSAAAQLIQVKQSQTAEDLQSRFRTTDPVFFVATQVTRFQLHKRKDFVRVDEALGRHNLNDWANRLLTEIAYV